MIGVVTADHKDHKHGSNRASAIGDPCTRWNILCQTRYGEKKPRDPIVEFIFRIGREMEKQARHDLIDSDLDVYKPDEALEVIEQPELNLVAYPDMLMRLKELPGERIPIEVKSCAPWIWQSINSEADLRNHKSRYVQRWAAQLQSEMAMLNASRGLWYLINKQTGVPKSFYAELDLDFWEWIFRKCETVNKHMADGTLPDIDVNRGTCEGCDFLHVCQPDLIANAPQIASQDEELLQALKRRAELHEAAKEFKRVHDGIVKKRISAYADEGATKLLVGDFLVEATKSSPRTKMVKDPGGATYTFWQIDIVDLEEGTSDGKQG